MPSGSSAYTYDRDGRLVQDVRENLTMSWVALSSKTTFDPGKGIKNETKPI
jgi:hypothetical protein